MERYEFRVRWQREGRQRTQVIYQTEKAARAKVDRILALEEVKPDTQFEDMPDLVGVPTLERRAIGPWNDHPEQPPTEPTEEAREGMAVWCSPNDDNYGPF